MKVVLAADGRLERIAKHVDPGSAHGEYIGSPSSSRARRRRSRARSRRRGAATPRCTTRMGSRSSLTVEATCARRRSEKWTGWRSTTTQIWHAHGRSSACTSPPDRRSARGRRGNWSRRRARRPPPRQAHLGRRARRCRARPRQGRGGRRGRRPALENADVFPVEGGTVAAALELAEGLRAGSFDAVVGIGGGRTLDVAKYAASLTGLPMVSVATNLAHDGLASPVASLEHDGRKGSYGVQAPIAVVVDLDQCAPARPSSSAQASAMRSAISAPSPTGSSPAASAGSPSTAWPPLSPCRRDLVALSHRRPALRDLCGRSRRGARAQRARDGRRREQPSLQRRLPRNLARHRRALPTARRTASRWRWGAFRFFLREDERLGALDAALLRHGVARTPSDLGLEEDEFAAAVAHALHSARPLHDPRASRPGRARDRRACAELRRPSSLSFAPKRSPSRSWARPPSIGPAACTCAASRPI